MKSKKRWEIWNKEDKHITATSTTKLDDSVIDLLQCHKYEIREIKFKG